MADFIPNKLSFDQAGFMNMFRMIIDTHLNVLSKFLVDIVRGQIMLNGNGSYEIMRLFAVALVRETKREITNDHITLEVGIDTKDLPEDAFVRVSVVLHGNQAGGKLMTKPGQQTWSKHVISKRVSSAKTEYALPEGFNQDDKSKDIMEHIAKNVENDANKRVDEFVNNLNHDLDRLNWSAFVTVG